MQPASMTLQLHAEGYILKSHQNAGINNKGVGSNVFNKSVDDFITHSLWNYSATNFIRT